MNIVLLSGGSGKRLWPLSNDINSKQFIKIFKNQNYKKDVGEYYESMLQRVYRQIISVNKDANITIATSKSQVSSIYNQLGKCVDISVEPAHRDTFPAIVLTAAYLHDVRHVDKEEAIVVCPVDPYISDEYFKAINRLWELAQNNASNIILMGIEPTYPSEKYGYIIPSTNEYISKVDSFKEKPSKDIAQKYIDVGGLWNGGVFAFKISYILKSAHNLIDFKDYYDLLKKYNTLDKISFDYAVVEREHDITVLRFAGEWKDLGTWNTLTEVMDEQTVGDVRMDDTCDNVHVINDLGIPILVMGIKDSIISASPQGLLVSDKEKSSYIKPYVDAIDQKIMFAEKSWGSFRVLEVSNNSMTIKVTLNPGHHMNYHSHDRRDEVWTVVSGVGRTVVDGMAQPVKSGDVVTMAAGCRHTIFAETELQLIEVQIGDDISVTDKHKYDLDI